MTQTLFINRNHGETSHATLPSCTMNLIKQKVESGLATNPMKLQCLLATRDNTNVIRFRFSMEMTSSLLLLIAQISLT